MAFTANDLAGNWATEGTQNGWSYPASGKWLGNLILRQGGNSTMSFSSGNVAPTRSGNWSLTGSQFSIIDTEGTRWTATVSQDGRRMSGSYYAGQNNAYGGGWGARKL